MSTRTNLLDLLSELSGGCKYQGLHLLLANINVLQYADDKGCRLTHTRLSLSDRILPFYQRDNRSLLDRRRLFETICVNSSAVRHQRKPPNFSQAYVYFKSAGRLIINKLLLSTSKHKIRSWYVSWREPTFWRNT